MAEEQTFPPLLSNEIRVLTWKTILDRFLVSNAFRHHVFCNSWWLKWTKFSSFSLASCSIFTRWYEAGFSSSNKYSTDVCQNGKRDSYKSELNCELFRAYKSYQFHKDKLNQWNDLWQIPSETDLC
jgi:hypothetical protein